MGEKQAENTTAKYGNGEDYSYLARHLNAGMLVSDESLKQNVLRCLQATGFKQNIADLAESDREALQIDFVVSDNAYHVSSRDLHKSPDIPVVYVSPKTGPGEIIKLIRETATKRFEVKKIDEWFPQVKKEAHSQENLDEQISQAFADRAHLTYFDAANRIREKELEALKQAEAEKLFILYSALYHDTQLEEFNDRASEFGHRLSVQDKIKWLASEIDDSETAERSGQFQRSKPTSIVFLELMGNLLANSENPAKDFDIETFRKTSGLESIVEEHRNRVLFLDFEVRGKNFGFITKVSPAPSVLGRESQLLEAYREIAAIVKKHHGFSHYLTFPSVYSVALRKADTETTEQRNDILVLSRLRGRRQDHQWTDLEKELETNQSQKTEDAVIRFARKKIENVAKFIAISYAAAIDNPECGELVDRVHKNPETEAAVRQNQAYYISRIHKKTIGEPSAQTDYSWTPFLGGFRELVGDEKKVHEYRKRFIAAIRPVLYHVAKAPSGLYTDRTLKNMVGSNGMVDFETLRDNPSIFDLVALTESGVGSNEHILNSPDEIKYKKNTLIEKGQQVSRNEFLLASFAGCLEEQISIVRRAMNAKRNRKLIVEEEILDTALPHIQDDFDKLKQLFHASAILYDAIYFAASMRMLDVQKDSQHHQYNVWAGRKGLLNTASHARKLCDFTSDKTEQKHYRQLAEIADEIRTDYFDKKYRTKE